MSDTLLFSFLRKGEGRGEEDRMKNRNRKEKEKKQSWDQVLKKGSTVLGLNPVHWYRYSSNFYYDWWNSFSRTPLLKIPGSSPGVQCLNST